MDRGDALLREVRADHSIILYLVTTCCVWMGGGALDCLDLETASGMRMYSLRKSWRMSTFRYLWRVQQWMVWFLLPSW